MNARRTRIPFGGLAIAPSSRNYGVVPSSNGTIVEELFLTEYAFDFWNHRRTVNVKQRAYEGQLLHKGFVRHNSEASA